MVTCLPSRWWKKWSFRGPRRRTELLAMARSSFPGKRLKHTCKHIQLLVPQQTCDKVCCFFPGMCCHYNQTFTSFCCRALRSFITTRTAMAVLAVCYVYSLIIQHSLGVNWKSLVLRNLTLSATELFSNLVLHESYSYRIPVYQCKGVWEAWYAEITASNLPFLRTFLACLYLKQTRPISSLVVSL